LWNFSHSILVKFKTVTPDLVAPLIAGSLNFKIKPDSAEKKNEIPAKMSIIAFVFGDVMIFFILRFLYFPLLLFLIV